jgi:hypothetical protein
MTASAPQRLAEDQFRCTVRIEGMREVVTVSEFTTAGAQMGKLVGGLDAFGHDALSRRVITLSPRVVALSPRVIALSRRVIALNPRVIVLSRRVITLSRRVITLSPRVITLSRRVIALSPRVIALSPRVIALSRRVITLSRRLAAISHSLHGLLATSLRRESFSPRGFLRGEKGSRRLTGCRRFQ